MFKKTLVAGAVAATLTPCFAMAAESDHTLTGNIGFFSQYVFRGIAQTDAKPALQGGLDYSHSSGFYAGTWASNVSWLRYAYTEGASLEWDFYGGFKGTFGKSDFGYDIGLLQYWYPGTELPGGTTADTLEVYGALSWKWLSAKLSYALSDEVFGVANADGTYYLDLSANIPVSEKFAVQLHWGNQKFTGTSPAGVDNDSFASYKDWKIGVSYTLPKDFTIGAFYTDTDVDDNPADPKGGFYRLPTGKFLAKDAFGIYLSKTF